MQALDKRVPSSLEKKSMQQLPKNNDHSSLELQVRRKRTSFPSKLSNLGVFSSSIQEYGQTWYSIARYDRSEMSHILTSQLLQLDILWKLGQEWIYSDNITVAGRSSGPDRRSKNVINIRKDFSKLRGKLCYVEVKFKISLGIRKNGFDQFKS